MADIARHLYQIHVKLGKNCAATVRSNSKVVFNQNFQYLHTAKHLYGIV